MSDMKTFKHRITGKYGRYPAHFESHPDFILCEPERCEGCRVQDPEPVEELDESEELEEVPEIEEEDTQW